MRTRAAFLIGGAVGYLLGTRAGREQLETVREQARRAWEDPRVQDVVADGQQRATQFVKDRAPELRDMVTGAVRSVSESRRDDQGPTGA
ncbi:YtxH domain-containing protein [Actinotalea sp.]|uniref:YtxH domain-containing protein n=1 Tax=Actinotalea sp. TaxID=1872145 RepID=UPI002C075F7F|nr:YtxH domain-containing protein [Actinotalea sp.]HQY33683.1 YtxH domain-containing protein [Actinotalea sp.]HRA51124.1 YtxH domain-containing protein [Actinotalea sp.]